MNILTKITSLLAAASLLMCGGCGKNSSKPADSTGELTVTFLDVEKADAIILRNHDHAVVIDCGEKGNGKEVAAELEEQGVTAVDQLIITHYDKDHVGGAAKGIKNCNVLSVICPDYSKDSDEMDKFNSALETKDLSPTLLTEEFSFEMADVSFTVYPAEKDFYGEEDENDFSLVVKAQHGENSLLFTGDAMEQRLEEIMDIGQCLFLKVPYHGRKLDNLEQFLNAVSPKCAVVCTSAEDFASSTRTLLEQEGIRTYSTCDNGRIEMVSDGKSLSFNTEK